VLFAFEQRRGRVERHEHAQQDEHGPHDQRHTCEHTRM
jgi:hypothetical protein